MEEQGFAVGTRKRTEMGTSHGVGAKDLGRLGQHGRNGVHGSETTVHGNNNGGNSGYDMTRPAPETRRTLPSAPPTDPESFARSYQLEALEMAIKQNTIVFLDTGSGKTLIAVMLLRAYAGFIRKPSTSIAVFLVPTVVLVSQQADVIEMHTDLKVGRFWGDMGVDFWNISIWKEKLEEFEVFVTTPQILLNNLRHSFFKLEDIKLLIFDECHHAKGKHPYACIMTEFYHKALSLRSIYLPRVFGMTASLINSKGSRSRDAYEKQIVGLENLMNSKVFTVANESVLADYIPFSTPKFTLYEQVDIPDNLFMGLRDRLEKLKLKYLCELKSLRLDESAEESAKKRISRLHDTFLFCLTELGVWLALKAASSHSCMENIPFPWMDQKDQFEEKMFRNFSLDVANSFVEYLPIDHCIGKNFKADMDAGFITTKVACLVNSLLAYRARKNLRCIVFVERVITAVVLQSLLSILPQLTGWRTRHMVGSHSGMQCQSRKEHLSIVDLFRDGDVNIIVATQILEEGLDVQSCNLVIRFDPSPTVCSFIQSRGRARMHGSDYLLILGRDDSSTRSRVSNYLRSGDMMREESLRLASIPCSPLEDGRYGESFYCVEKTGAIVTLSSSVSLIYFYCSRLPCDGFFKPLPRFVIENGSNVCTLHLPNSCSMFPISVEGNHCMLKQLACLEACKKLHECGALTDNLLPVLDTEIEDDCTKFGNHVCPEKQSNYFPWELVDSWRSFSVIGQYYCYKIVFLSNFSYKFSANDIFLVVKSNLGDEFPNMSFNLETSRGDLNVKVEYMHIIHLDPEEILLARKFQSILLNIGIHHCFDKLKCALDNLCEDEFYMRSAYLLLPSIVINNVYFIDWVSIKSVLLSHEEISSQSTCKNVDVHHCSQVNCHWMQLKNGMVRSCMIQNSVVYTPHNNHIYCITGVFDELNGESVLKLKEEDGLTYKDYYKSRHGITLFRPKESLLSGRQPFKAQNYLKRRVYQERGLRNAGVELPPELCLIFLTPVNANTLYSFSLLPSIMNRIESMLLVSNLYIQSDHLRKNPTLPIKLFEATTAKKCGEKLCLESLETLGDSFLKYASSLHLFKQDGYHHEGILSAKKDCLVSNMTLYRLGCERKLPGFIRNEEFDAKEWVSSHNSRVFLQEDKIYCSGSRFVYTFGSRFIKIKRVADVVEALVGAYLCTMGETAALHFMKWLGMNININFEMPLDKPLLSKAHMYVNVKLIELLLKYTFHDPSLLVEALTHGSYQVPDVPRCYQRLEFLGDAVLDYLVTVHMYKTYPQLSPGELTDLRSASVNNDCYAHAAIKAGLNKHILHASSKLHRQMTEYFGNSSKRYTGPSYGWEAGMGLPKVLGDVIESLAGAILVDSGYDKNRVWESIRPLLEPLVSPETMKYHPVRELVELCQRRDYRIKFNRTCQEGVASMTAEVETDDGFTIRETRTAEKKMAKKLAASAVLESLKVHHHSCSAN